MFDINHIKELQKSYIFRPNILNLPNNITEPYLLSSNDIKPINEKIRHILSGLSDRNYSTSLTNIKKLLKESIDFYNYSALYFDVDIPDNVHIIKSQNEYDSFLINVVREFLLNMISQELSESGRKNIDNYIKLISNIVVINMNKQNLGSLFLSELKNNMFYAFTFDNSTTNNIIMNINDIYDTILSNSDDNGEEAEILLDKSKGNIIKTKNIVYICTKLFLNSFEEKPMYFLKKENYYFFINKLITKFFNFVELNKNIINEISILENKVKESKSRQIEINNKFESDGEISPGEYNNLYAELDRIDELLQKLDLDYFETKKNFDKVEMIKELYLDIMMSLFSTILPILKQNDMNKYTEFVNILNNKIYKEITNSRIKSLYSELNISL